MSQLDAKETHTAALGESVLHVDRLRAATTIIPMIVDVSGVFVLIHILMVFLFGFPVQLTVTTIATGLMLTLCRVAQRLTYQGRLGFTIYTLMIAISVQIIIQPVLVEGMIVFSLTLGYMAIFLLRLIANQRQLGIAALFTGAAMVTAILLSQSKLFSELPTPQVFQRIVSIISLVVSLAVTIYTLNWRVQLYETYLENTEQYATELDIHRAELLERREELQKAHTDLAIRTADLEKINVQLENTLRTSQRRAALLQASTQVSNAIVQIRDLDQLLSEVTELVSRHFGFYHAGIFLIDPLGHYAVLQAANSPGGQRMLARRHKLRVGDQGLVGRATATGEPGIAQAVEDDPYYFDNPDMPDTRSEVAVPLCIGDEIVGALDVQSTETNAFDEEDIATLSTMADQIAIAIYNARLFQQTQAALAEAEEANRRYLRQEWDGFLGAGRKRRPIQETLSTGSGTTPES